MADVLLFHHIQGLTDGVRAFADELRTAGHTVHTPDLFEGRSFGSIEEGFAYAGEAGFDTIRARGLAAADGLGADLVLDTRSPERRLAVENHHYRATGRQRCPLILRPHASHRIERPHDEAGREHKHSQCPEGQPWLPGQIGRRIETGSVEGAPSLTEQHHYIRALYDEVCHHYGLRIGLRHARKHLGWALDVAARCSRAPAEMVKTWRGKILTSEDPAGVQRALQDAFDDFSWSAAA